MISFKHFSFSIIFLLILAITSIKTTQKAESSTKTPATSIKSRKTTQKAESSTKTHTTATGT